jgi:release factor glutamine methyltransferase
LASSLQPRLHGTVDILLFNPPYVPTPDDELNTAGSTIKAAWAGGHKGRRVLDRLLPQLPKLMSPRGEIFLLVVEENDPDAILVEMNRLGFQGKRVMIRNADEERLSVLYFSRENEN